MLNQSQITVERTFLDRVIGVFSPSAELHRVRARVSLAVATRTFEGASKGRRTQNWFTQNSSINALIAGGLPMLRSRSRYLCRNQGYAAKAVNVWQTNIVGDGIIPSVKSKSRPDLATKLGELWIAWGDEAVCDNSGRQDFYGLQALGARTAVESGSFLIRRIWRRVKDGLPVPMQIQLLEPDHLDTYRDRILDDGSRIIQGIEYDKSGRRVAYHLFNEHPGDRFMLVNGLVSERVPADDIIHVFRMDRIGQADGVPWSAPTIIKLKDLDEYEDAELIRQKIAACFVGFIHDIEAMDADTTSGSTAAAPLEKVEPGILETLPPGKTVTFGSPPPAQNYGPHTQQVLRSIAAGFGMTYEALTGDYSQVNFSSGRMGALEFSRSIRQVQNHMMVTQMCKGVWRWFNEAAILAGKADDFIPASWTAPAREMIDPLKETQAVEKQIRIGIKSLSEGIRERGKDPEDVLGEIESDNAILDAKKIVVDSDPRKDISTPAKQVAG